MAQHYYYIRIYEDGKPVHTRCEKASGPREACKLAYGVIYDRNSDTVRYLDLGGRSPRYMSLRQKSAMVSDPKNWKPIPKSGL